MGNLGFRCHDFSSPQSLGLKNEDFRDEMHTRPYVYKSILQIIYGNTIVSAELLSLQ